MKQIDIAQLVAILANIGVIAGIVFLGIELRQNNDLMRAEARATRVSLSQAAFLPLMQSSHLAEAVQPSLGNDGDIEALLSTFYYQYILVGWEYSYFEVQLGALDESAISVNGWRGLFDLMPGLRAHYEFARDTFRPQFAEFIDSEVLRTQ